VDDVHKNFSVWIFRERTWQEGDAGRKISGGFDEPAEAADHAETVLKSQGVIGQSYCELRFNGDSTPHTVICYLGEHEFGIWNTDVSRWPIFYAEGGADFMLDSFPFIEADDGNTWQATDESDNKEKSDEGNVKLDDSDEGTEDEEIPEDDSAEDGDDTEDDEDATDTEDGDDEEEEEDDEDTDQEDGTDGDGEENAEEDFNDEEDDESEEEDDLDDDLDTDEEEEEIEMPRLRIFAKFRGPLGWRKRAVAEELQDKNTFALKLGVLDPDAEKTVDQEREVFFQMQFIEFDEDHIAGVLRLKMPEGIEFSEPTKSGWITAAIPFRQEGE